MADLLVEVRIECRAWGDMRRTHKMGWLRAGDLIRFVGEYKNWRRFEIEQGCDDLVPTDENYRDYYVNVNDLTYVVVDGNGPPPPPDIDVVEALRILIQFIKAV